MYSLWSVLSLHSTSGHNHTSGLAKDEIKLKSFRVPSNAVWHATPLGLRPWRVQSIMAYQPWGWWPNSGPEMVWTLSLVSTYRYAFSTFPPSISKSLRAAIRKHKWHCTFLNRQRLVLLSKMELQSSPIKPFQAYTGHRPSTRYLRVFGYPVIDKTGHAHQCWSLSWLHSHGQKHNIHGQHNQKN
jgi:hypothetical protein